MLSTILAVVASAQHQGSFRSSGTAHVAQGACPDVSGFDCADAWSWNCAGPANRDNGDCDTLKNCKATCQSRYNLTCEEMAASEARVCGGGGGGGLTDGGCTRGGEPENYAGYKMHFVESRDGSFTQDGDYITVTKARATPSWCRDQSVLPPQAGETMLWSEYYMRVGLHKLACVGWTEAMHKSSLCSLGACETQKNSAMKKVYDYESLAQSAGYFPDFAAYGSYESSAADLAAFLAHSSKETMGSNPTADNAWCWVNEGTCAANGCSAYGTVANPGQNCPAKYGSPSNRSYVVPPEYRANLSSAAAWNDGYWGRGAIQLSYCYNYQFFTNWVKNELKIPFTPETDFYSNPGFVGTRNWAFAAGLWFYMSGSSDGLKPSMHSVVDTWESGVLLFDQAGRRSDIGYQVNILNGGVECGVGASGHSSQQRLTALNDFMRKMNYPGAQGGSYLHLPHLVPDGCVGASNLANPGFMYWDVDGLHCSGDSLCSCEDDEVCPRSSDFSDPVTTSTPITTTTTVRTTTTTMATTRPAVTTTTTTPDGSHKCCVMASSLSSAAVCHGSYSESSCSANAECIWAPKGSCVDRVVDDSEGPPTPTQNPEGKKCCVIASQLSRHSECERSTEDSCNSSACIWTDATDCLDRIAAF